MPETVSGPEPSQLNAAKRRMRGQMADLRGAVEPQVAQRAAETAASALIALRRTRRAARIGLYAALPDELPTRPLFEAVIEIGAEACFPRTPARPPLEFAAIRDWDAMLPGRLGILEPPPDAPPASFGGDDVVVVPGVAFDADGGRLGRGRGYYDQTFAASGEAVPTLIGFAYEFQMVDCVPSDASDRRVDAVVTECGVHGKGIQ
jgi:5-formyltetrahydrofolate cyclo-ligase